MKEFLMRKILLTSVLFLSIPVLADRIKSTTVACPSVETLQRLEESEAGFTEKNLYIMQKGCVEPISKTPTAGNGTQKV